MTLSAGTRLGNYEILAPLGAGGMGEVYRARDLRLGRSVAIKALPESLARDPERVERLEREARALASVQHANIAVLYGVEDRDGASYLALELVEGETLSQRLARGPLDVAETLSVGAQIAAALDAAHEQGIVHRDLKPGNVMITAAGTVKVLDFGLAKTGPTAPDSSSNLSASPTVAFGSTAAGMVLGTAAYMSPEQARGKPVDRRTDVWALGCVLYECLTGRPAFAGETTSDVLARVLERDPDWALLPGATPSRLRDLLRRCLVKSVADRPRDAGDLRGELQAIAADLSSPRAAAGSAPSLAVLYFENLSPEPESDYFCAGITEDILTDLSKIKGLRVASRNAVARYRGTPADLTRVAADLGVGAVLEGSVRRAGPRVRITVRLASADGFQLWGERFDRTLDDVFAVQEEIATAIVAALKVALTPAESERIGQGRPSAAQAYDLYLKGREQYRRYQPTALREAIRLFEQAIGVDPQYALAWAGIGDAYGQLLQWGGPADDPADLTRRGLEAARRAIALNPKLPEAHKAEALVLGFSGDRPGSDAALRRALEADPRFVPALGNLAAARFAQGSIAEAERLIRRSIEIEPEDPHMHAWAAVVTECTGRLDEAVVHLERILRLSNESFYTTLAHLQRAWIARRSGRPWDEQGWLEEARRGGVDAAHVAMVEADQAARAGDSARAARLLGEFAGTNASLNFGGAFFATLAALRIGRSDLTVDLMRRAALREHATVLIRLDPQLRPLLDLEAFAPRRVALTLVWPIEAPMPDRALLPLFREIRLDTGTPEGSDLLARE